MHGGMYFELDEGFSVRADGVRRRELARVEHYGKGAPPDTERFLRARPVPAVSGAFMSVSRDWFETLGGFSSDYVFGHYEDADLCLRSLAAGTEVWMHPVPFWHMEGKGSSRRPMHEGGSLVNRWYFTRTWAGVLRDGLLGPAPARLVAA
jgi:GT2 family glycosyltransferase